MSVSHVHVVTALVACTQRWGLRRPNGTFISQLYAVDPEDDPLQFTIVDRLGGPFSITPNLDLATTNHGAPVYQTRQLATQLWMQTVQ